MQTPGLALVARGRNEKFCRFFTDAERLISHLWTILTACDVESVKRSIRGQTEPFGMAL